ncbi:MAG: hypothetical protein DRO88_01740 [Promethearchaeia archaeon]|nr:MAG: hypothetical protein DRO88_01740 [Candidatus Lokiarchaeia archaeon]
MRFQDEKEYYVELLEKFDEQVIQKNNDLDEFFAKEIISIMHELKQEKENIPLMLNITKNMLLILLSFYHEQRNHKEYTAFCELAEGQKNHIKNCLFSLI